MNSNTTDDQDVLLTRDEVAQIFRCHKITIIHWDKNPEFPKPIRVGRRPLYSKQQIADYRTKKFLVANSAANGGA